MHRIARPRHAGPSPQWTGEPRSSAALRWLGILLLFSALACGDTENPPEAGAKAGRASEQVLRAAATDPQPSDASDSDPLPPPDPAGDETPESAESTDEPVLSALRDRLSRENAARQERQAAAQDARLAYETAQARLEQKTQDLSAAREAADSALAQVDEIEPEVRAAEAELRKAEEILRELGAEVAAAGSPGPDALLFRSVQRELLEAAALAKVAVSAEVADGVVTLRGVVPDPDTRAAALSIAESVEGVLGVEDQLTPALEEH